MEGGWPWGGAVVHLTIASMSELETKTLSSLDQVLVVDSCSVGVPFGSASSRSQVASRSSRGCARFRACDMNK